MKIVFGKTQPSLRLLRIISGKPHFFESAFTAMAIRFVFVASVFALSIHLLK
jgi:hypothetical protein